MQRLVTALLIVVAMSASAFAQSLPVPSYWRSQRGSEMKIYTVDAQGIFKGIFVQHDGGLTCENTPYNLAGREKGNHVEFTVVWINFVENCNSQTFWHGHIEGKTIRTRWVLYSQGKVPLSLSGTDIFQLQP
jgi:Avidin family